MTAVEFGYINTVDPEKGSATVYFSDRDHISGEMPLFCMAGDYHMPEPDEQVTVIRTGRGASDGIILGRHWNENNPPPVSRGVYRDMGEGTFIKQENGRIVFSDTEGTISVGDIIRRLEELEERE